LPATLYLGTDSASGQGVLKSTDGGNTWNISGPAGDTINALAVNPAYPATVYAGLNGGRDAFISFLTPSGQLYSSTYLGGSGADLGNAVALMDLTTVILVGSTSSKDFPTTAAMRSAVKPHISNAGVLVTDPATETGSDTSDNNIFSGVLAYLVGQGPCPENEVENYMMKTNDFFEATIRTAYGSGASETLTQPSGTVPPGINIQHFTANDPDIDHLAELSGVATKAGNYSVTIYFDDHLCHWSLTINWIVTN
jgi:hypothetical protein